MTDTPKYGFAWWNKLTKQEKAAALEPDFAAGESNTAIKEKYDLTSGQVARQRDNRNERLKLGRFKEKEAEPAVAPAPIPPSVPPHREEKPAQQVAKKESRLKKPAQNKAPKPKKEAARASDSAPTTQKPSVPTPAPPPVIPPEEPKVEQKSQLPAPPVTTPLKGSGLAPSKGERSPFPTDEEAGEDVSAVRFLQRNMYKD